MGATAYRIDEIRDQSQVAAAVAPRSAVHIPLFVEINDLLRIFMTRSGVDMSDDHLAVLEYALDFPFGP